MQRLSHITKLLYSTNDIGFSMTSTIIPADFPGLSNGCRWAHADRTLEARRQHPNQPAEETL